MRAGSDSHERSLAVAVVDDAGRRQQAAVFANDPKGHLRLGRWLAKVGVTRVGHVGAGTTDWCPSWRYLQTPMCR